MSDKRPEQSIASARASVMLYDHQNKKWIPSGATHGISKVHIYHHFIYNTFRVVGWKLQDHEVVINCDIAKGLKYNQATSTFHQWKDQRQVYGLNFSSKDDAEMFSAAMLKSLEILNSGGNLTMRPLPNSVQHQQLQKQSSSHQLLQQQQQPVQQPVQQQQQQQHPVYQQPHQVGGGEQLYEIYDDYNSQISKTHDNGNGHYGGSDPGYDSHAHMVQQQQYAHDMEMERRLSLQQHNHQIHQVHSTPNMQTQQQQQQHSPTNNSLDGSPTLNHQSVSAQSQILPGPPAQPMVPSSCISAPPPPGAPMVSSGGAPPPPPPPLPTGGVGGDSGAVGGLAAALQAAKLKKTQIRSTENSGNSTTSSNSSGYGTIGRRESTTGSGGGMASMMDEMQKTLARRRAKVDKQEDDDKSVEKSSESPRQVRKRFGSNAEDLDIQKINGNDTVALSSEMEILKQEILKEMRKDLNKIKQEIIEAVRLELDRR